MRFVAFRLPVLFEGVLRLSRLSKPGSTSASFQGGLVLGPFSRRDDSIFACFVESFLSFLPRTFRGLVETLEVQKHDQVHNVYAA